MLPSTHVPRVLTLRAIDKLSTPGEQLNALVAEYERVKAATKKETEAEQAKAAKAAQDAAATMKAVTAELQCESTHYKCITASLRESETRIKAMEEQVDELRSELAAAEAVARVSRRMSSRAGCRASSRRRKPSWRQKISELAAKEAELRELVEVHTKSLTTHQSDTATLSSSHAANVAKLEAKLAACVAARTPLHAPLPRMVATSSRPPRLRSREGARATSAGLSRTSMYGNVARAAWPTPCTAPSPGHAPSRRRSLDVTFGLA